MRLLSVAAFNWRRCALRSSLVAVMVLLGEAVPRFDLVMGLIGGSLTGPLMFVLPPLFYARLRGMSWRARLLRSRPLPSGGLRPQSPGSAATPRHAAKDGAETVLWPGHSELDLERDRPGLQACRPGLVPPGWDGSNWDRAGQGRAW